MGKKQTTLYGINNFLPKMEEKIKKDRKTYLIKEEINR